MNLIVDIGNTLVKSALLERGRVVEEHADGAFCPEAVAGLLERGRVRRAILSSTRGEMPEVAAWLCERVSSLLLFTPQTPVPIRNVYRTPQTLGRDRLAAAVGATVLFPGRNVLIVDFGTAVTIDLVTADATYRGGCISPGVQLRFGALHDHTAALPLCRPSDEEGLQGLTTEEAVTRGVMNSVAFEIEGYIRRMEAQIDGLCVIFTGGDAKYFVKRIKNTIFASCNLVYCGLERILEYNASEEYLD
ncbi:type III pantothenate kinase [uncultured Alistipes sp.]|uniref:type III pantothenate kinase n=1 Tax=uncultured Alistipes sp. TaxID=538949 RepID=UPI0025F03773|nr:type III pantothenate kinase [uncultured Alistipes sp.]